MIKCDSSGHFSGLSVYKRTHSSLYHYQEDPLQVQCSATPLQLNHLAVHIQEPTRVYKYIYDMYIRVHYYCTHPYLVWVSPPVFVRLLFWTPLTHVAITARHYLRARARAPIYSKVCYLPLTWYSTPNYELPAETNLGRDSRCCWRISV